MHLGDPHNFGKSVRLTRNGLIYKPRTLVWEHLLLSDFGNLRSLLGLISAQSGLSPSVDVLPNLNFKPRTTPAFISDGYVQPSKLLPIVNLIPSEARSIGAVIALCTYLGISDLHSENTVLGRDASLRLHFGPIDIESIFWPLSLPSQTGLIPLTKALNTT